MTQRVLITGAGGMLGRELVDVFTDWDVVAASHAQLDVGDRDATVGAVTSLRPDVVIHAAAMTNVDACETDPERAFLVNAMGTRHVAEGARRAGAHLVHVSTDYVFDGTKGEPYHEWDATNPLSVYGLSKLGAEHEIDPGSTIVRTSWVFGRHGSNFVKTVVKLAADGDGGELRMVDDQRGCPTSAADLASMIRRLAAGRVPGLFHVSNQSGASRYEMAQDILRFAGQSPERVVPITSADMPRPAPRPANSELDNLALRSTGVPLLPDHHEPLERLVKELTA